MKMTMHIDETVLADVLALTGASSKTEAVELALKDLARRQRQRGILQEGLMLDPRQWDVVSRPAPADDLDAPDIDHDAVRRYLVSTAPDRPRPEMLGLVAEPGPAPSRPRPPAGSDAAPTA